MRLWELGGRETPGVGVGGGGTGETVKSVRGSACSVAGCMQLPDCKSTDESSVLFQSAHTVSLLLPQVLEYSELDPATASATNPATGKLFYNWSNICMHYFALPWLKAAAQHLRSAAVYHIAHKQIPAKGGVKVPGLKLEMFIFDPFCTADKTTLLEVCVEVYQPG